MTEPQIDYSVVIPTIGRANLAELVAAVDRTPAPARIVIADDRPDTAAPLKLPTTSAPLVVVRSERLEAPLQLRRARQSRASSPT